MASDAKVYCPDCGWAYTNPKFLALHRKYGAPVADYARRMFKIRVGS